jgi:GNAT superfamily N-acetyltransferase
MASSTAISTAIANEPILGDTKPSISPPKETFLVRPMRLSDIPIVGELNRLAYWLSPVNQFLAPRAQEHPEQLTRQFCQSIRRRYVNPNSLSVVACLKENPTIPVGYAQFARLGDDEGARRWVREKGLLWRIWIYILSWIFWAYDKISMFLSPDTVSDLDHIKLFETWIQKDTAKYWTPYPERNNCWHANSVVVSPDYQGQGVGKLLIRAGLAEAQKERKPMRLVASIHGEYLYRKVGFVWLGDFCSRVEDVDKLIDEGSGGGYMCWFPEGWEGRTLAEGEGDVKP